MSIVAGVQDRNPGTTNRPISAGTPGQSGAGAQDIDPCAITLMAKGGLRGASRKTVGESGPLRSIQDLIDPLLDS